LLERGDESEDEYGNPVEMGLMMLPQRHQAAWAKPPMAMQRRLQKPLIASMRSVTLNLIPPI